MTKKKKTLIWIIVGIAVAILLYVLFSNVIGGPKSINMIEFLNKIASGEITKIYVDKFLTLLERR